MFKIGDKVKIVDENSGNYKQFIGMTTTITELSTIQNNRYHLKGVSIACGWWNSTELELVKEEKTMSTKAYKVIEDTPLWNKGAILTPTASGDGYVAVEDLWDAVEGGLKGEYLSKHIIENSPKFFQRVYEMSKGKRAVYVTKEKAQELASKFFEGE